MCNTSIDQVHRSRSMFQSIRNLVINSYYFLLLHVNPFWFQLCYFLILSVLGFLLLKALDFPTRIPPTPSDLDLLFTAVSATTVSSMSTVEMEIFSNSHLILLTILMLTGGEIFTSIFGLRFELSKLKMMRSRSTRDSNDKEEDDCLESNNKTDSNDDLVKYRSIKLLIRLVSTYFMVIQALGVIMVAAYITLSESASTVQKSKGLKISTFSIFTVISTFANCGFIPTNENMVVFRRNSGLLLILIPQILLGNTLFPPCLRIFIWVVGKLTPRRKRAEKDGNETHQRQYYDYLLSHTEEYCCYPHLLPRRYCWSLALTVVGLIVVQFAVFYAAELRGVLSGFSGGASEKFVAVMFQCVNSRFTGETVVDLSAVAPVVLVLFVAMMYLPPYTALVPIRTTTQSSHEEERVLDQQQDARQECISSTTAGKKKQLLRNSMNFNVETLIFSQLSYLLIFILVICVTEREGLQKDPLNFSVLNIVVEVISAYGNVGFSTGYSCARRRLVIINPDDDDGGASSCIDKSYGFSGRWSTEGKITLILVMIFGRLKKFNMQGGKAWKLQ